MPLPVITLTVDRRPGLQVFCDVAGCVKVPVAAWQVTRSGRIFGERWIAGETVELCREHDERAARVTGAEDGR
ncbi:hypothetical protein AB0J14_35430 [Micromonospora arborensis]|uniref:Uncharacterized protein n=1 Tax=Micromonospora tarensis TaxID=2806100 RepID=A0ABS1Y9G5_9ACTN|nr:hypothetical protein [Micromonospora tarensis]MBM0274038.1 hypothetical protein [Micromonospora tarensis]